MRLDARDYPPHTGALFDDVRVLLDGRVMDLSRVVWADDETGEVYYYRHDAKGEVYCEGDDIAYDILRGVVVIEQTPEGAARRAAFRG